MTVTDPIETRPTLVDVASAAGVSTATVSRVLNGFTNVRQETRDQVERTMHAMGYVRHRAPRRLPTDRAGSIALVVCEEGMRLFSDPFFARVLGGVSRALASTDTQLVLLITQSVKDYETSVLRYLRSGHADGALFVSMHGRYPIDLARIGVPVVSTGPTGVCSGRTLFLRRLGQPGRRAPRGAAPDRERPQERRHRRGTARHDAGYRPAGRLSRRGHRPPGTTTPDLSRTAISASHRENTSSGCCWTGGPTSTRSSWHRT